jgi:flagellar hook-basal body complex protein FliE
MQSIQRVGFPSPAQFSVATGRVTNLSAETPSFRNMLFKAIVKIQSSEHDAKLAVSKPHAGQTHLAESRASIEKANQAFRTMMDVRNSLVGAYNEIKDLRI